MALNEKMKLQEQQLKDQKVIIDDKKKQLNMYQEKVLDLEEKLNMYQEKVLDQEKKLNMYQENVLYQEEKLLMQQQQILNQDEKLDWLLSKISLSEQNQMCKEEMDWIKIIILICAIVGCMIMLVK
jgi:hypothetical protein